MPPSSSSLTCMLYIEAHRTSDAQLQWVQLNADAFSGECSLCSNARLVLRRQQQKKLIHLVARGTVMGPESVLAPQPTFI